MNQQQPITEFTGAFSDPAATATPWTDVDALLTEAEIFWITTVRPDGRPHQTPLIGVWLDTRLHICTGLAERKARNLEQNQHCLVSTGNNSYNSGLDIVVEGDAVRVTEEPRLRTLAAAWEAKYGSNWHFEVSGGAFTSGDTSAAVFAIAPAKILAFGKGTFSQTRYRFAG